VVVMVVENRARKAFNEPLQSLYNIVSA